jgi:hypothetical protein
MKIAPLVVAFIASVANAGVLDIFRYGVKENPDHYASMELMATYNHQMGLGQMPDLGPLGANQISQYNDRGLKGRLSIPLDKNSTFLVGGNWYTGDYAYDGTSLFPSQIGTVKGFGLEAGVRFYIHD